MRHDPDARRTMKRRLNCCCIVRIAVVCAPAVKDKVESVDRQHSPPRSKQSTAIPIGGDDVRCRLAQSDLKWTIISLHHCCHQQGKQPRFFWFSKNKPADISRCCPWQNQHVGEAISEWGCPLRLSKECESPLRVQGPGSARVELAMHLISSFI